METRYEHAVPGLSSLLLRRQYQQFWGLGGAHRLRGNAHLAMSLTCASASAVTVWSCSCRRATSSRDSLAPSSALWRSCSAACALVLASLSLAVQRAAPRRPAPGAARCRSPRALPSAASSSRLRRRLSSFSALS